MGFYDAIRIGASGAADFTVDRSLRINRPDDPKLYRTGSNNADTFTVSFWMKIGNIYNSYRTLFGSYADGLTLNNDHRLRYSDEGDGSFYSTAKFRDPTAWYHIVMAVNTSGTTVYVNNVTHITSSSKFSLSTASNAIRHFWTAGDPAEFAFGGYGAEVALIDGQALTPSSFAETNAITGQWTPKDLSELTFGSNGHYLKFTDSSNLGKDFSGNNNNFTVVNYGTSDAVKDSPTNNFCTLNPLSRTNKTESEGNLETRANDGAWRSGSTTFHMSSGKWYWELHVTALGSYQMHGIVPAVRQNGKVNFNADVYPGSYSNEWGYANNGTLYNSASGTSSWGSTYTTGDILSFALDMDNGTLDIKKNNSATGSQITGISGEYKPAFTNWATSSITNVNFGQDSSFAGEKTAQGNTDGNGQGDFYYAPPSGYLALCSANLPDPTILLPDNHFDTLLFSGTGNSGRTVTGLEFQPDWFWGKSRSAGFQHILYDSVRGTGTSKSLSSNQANAEGHNSAHSNLTSFDSAGVTFGATSSTDVLNYSGGNSVGWFWNAGETDSATYRVVVVSDSGNKYRFRNSANSATFAQSAVTLNLAEGGTYTFDGSDSTMASHPIKLSTTANGTHGGGSSYNTGVTYELDGSTVTESAYVSGYSSATSRKLIITVAASAPTLYYYCHVHSGMGGQINTNSTLGSSNFDGSIQSTAKVNATAGFSITAYSGNGSNAQTVGHGLGVAPDVIILKSRTAGSNWRVWHKSLATDGSKRLILDSTNASEDASFLNDTAPTSTIFTLGNSDNAWNASGGTYITYIFSEVSSYSKFGSYKGNGSSDGPFVFTGFKPAVIIFKNASTATNWEIYDTKRQPNNPTLRNLYPNSTSAEETSSVVEIDILSNGFKIKTSWSEINNNNDTHIFIAFAESPFKNARAR